MTDVFFNFDDRGRRDIFSKIIPSWMPKKLAVGNS